MIWLLRIWSYVSVLSVIYYLFCHFFQIFAVTYYERGETNESVISLNVNGHNHAVDVDPETPLLYILRNDLKLNGAKFGCGVGQCGSCTVIVEGEAVRSCITPVGSVKGRKITVPARGAVIISILDT